MRQRHRWNVPGGRRARLVVALLAIGSFSSLSPALALRQASPAFGWPSKTRAEMQWAQLSTVGTQMPSIATLAESRRQVAAMPVDAAAGTWQPLGPQPIWEPALRLRFAGRVAALAVNPKNSQDVWAGAASGGVWHTTNGGKHWQPMTDNQPVLATGALAIDPNDPNVVYAGTGEGNIGVYWGAGVLKTTDAGQTWKQYGFGQFGGLSIGKIAIDPSNSQVLLLSATWASWTTPPGGASGVIKNLGIWRSADGGQTWTQVLSDPGVMYPDAGTDVVFDPSGSGVAFAGMGNLFGANPTTKSGVWRSADHGRTWTQLHAGIPTGSDIERVSLGISHDGQHLYAVLTDGDERDYVKSGTQPYFGYLLHHAVYISADGGATWKTQDVSSVPGMATDNGVHQWWYDTDAAVDPTVAGGSVAYVGGVDIWQTRDGGKTWRNLTYAYQGGPVHPDEHAFAFAGPASSDYYAGNDGGVWHGTRAVKWTDLNTDLSITQFYGGAIGTVGKDNELYGGTQDNGQDAYPGHNLTVPRMWNIVMYGDGGYSAVDFTDNAVAYGEMLGLDQQHVHIYKTMDGGKTWKLANTGFHAGAGADPMNFVVPLFMSPSNHQELFAGTDRVYRTTDEAGAWKPLGGSLDGGSPISMIAVAPSNDGDIYAGDNAGSVFATTDGGQTWTGGPVPGSTRGMVRGLAVDPQHPATVYASFAAFSRGAGGHVFKSTDAGRHWKDISVGLPNVPFSSLLVDPATGQLLAGCDTGVYALDSTGAWARFGTGLPNVPVVQLFTDHTGQDLYVATHGRGMWRLRP